MQRHTKCFLFIYLIFVNTLVSAQTWPSATQTKTVKRLSTYVSSFLTTAQYTAVCNQVTNAVLAQQTFATIKSAVTSSLVSGLSLTQYASILSKGTTLIFSLGASGITTALANLSVVISNNLAPVYAQLVEYGQTLKAQGLQNKGIAKNTHRIVNSFASAKRIKTIFTRASLKFTASQWSSIKSALSSVLQFTKNGV